VSLEIDPEPMGAADGKWTGNVFTIRTAHLLGTTLIDSAGMPHSDGMKLTEKLRLISPDVLEDRILFDDPATFTKPWETVVTYRRQNSTLRNDEDVCLDRIRDGQPAVKEVTP